MTVQVLALTVCLYSNDNLLNAICKVESNCEESAVGDSGNAIGPYQIWYVYWKDAIDYRPSIGGSYSDCVNKEYSEQIIKAYWDRYANENRLGRKVTDEDRARIHNGGPNGWKKKSTIKYWNKVKSFIHDRNSQHH